YHYRGLPNPMLEVFNQPNSDLSCEQRIASTVTPQVFTLFNGQDSYNRALAMAQRLDRERSDLKSQIERAMALAWNRPAEAKEVKASADFVAKMVEYHEENEPIDPKYPVKIERTMFEEMTGEEFSYTERLDVYENYVADVAPSEVSPETRALADLCRVLFNANEFVYVY
ncbi:MAG: DUF1553 domain-containing protein, partial [Bacteroidota bacterium]